MEIKDNLLQCIKCEETFSFPQAKDDYLGHLFLEHRLVIADVEEVPLLEDYLRFWIAEFQDHDLDQYCTTMLLDQKPDGTPAKNERYYLLSDILPKDFELRRRLHQQKLAQALEQHKFELTDRNFSKECLYCRDVISGLRSDYLAHLFQKHFLQLGKPENLVYIDELLAKVQHNLEHLICLYCEKTFKDRVTLKEHMRKKAHKRINPNNRVYDRYFLVNYRNEQLRPQKHLHRNRRESLEERRVIDAVYNSESAAEPEIRSVNAHSDDSDSEWSDWADEQPASLNCLYCQRKETAFTALKQHMLSTHHVDFDAEVYLKRCVTCDGRFETCEALQEHLENESHFGVGTSKLWDKPEYFFPFFTDDGLLCVLDDSANDADDTVVRIISEDTVAQINKDAERLSLENFSFL